MKIQPDTYDVVIYNIETKKIESIAGSDLPMCSGFHSASKRLATVAPRLNEHYDCSIVPSGKYKEGDTLDLNDNFIAGSEATFVPSED